MAQQRDKSGDPEPLVFVLCINSTGASCAGCEGLHKASHWLCPTRIVHLESNILYNVVDKEIFHISSVLTIVFK